MLRYHVSLVLKENSYSQFERVLREEFVPAIAERKGFRALSLGHSRVDPTEFGLDLDFATEGDRVEWVQSPEHARVWPRLNEFLETVNGTGFDVVLERTAAT